MDIIFKNKIYAILIDNNQVNIAYYFCKYILLYIF